VDYSDDHLFPGRYSSARILCFHTVEKSTGFLLAGHLYFVFRPILSYATGIKKHIQKALLAAAMKSVCSSEATLKKTPGSF
jgi:hypothetical protein